MEYGLDVADCVDVTFIWPCSSFTIGKPTDENIFERQYLNKRKSFLFWTKNKSTVATTPKVSFIKRDDTFDTYLYRRCMDIRDVD